MTDGAMSPTTVDLLPIVRSYILNGSLVGVGSRVSDNFGDVHPAVRIRQVGAVGGEIRLQMIIVAETLKQAREAWVELDAYLNCRAPALEGVICSWCARDEGYPFDGQIETGEPAVTSVYSFEIERIG